MPIQYGVVIEIDWENNEREVGAVLDPKGMINLSLANIQLFKQFKVKIPKFSLGEIIFSEDRKTELNGERDLDEGRIYWFDDIEHALRKSIELRKI